MKKEVRSLRQLNIGDPFRYQEQHKTSAPGPVVGNLGVGMYLAVRGLLKAWRAETMALSP